MVHSILEKVSSADIQLDPFPHLVIENALPDDYYQMLADCYPEIDLLAGGQRLENNTAYFKSANVIVKNRKYQKIWQEFVDYHSSPLFFRDVMGVWSDEIRKNFSDVKNMVGKDVPDFLPVRRQPGKWKNKKNRQADIVLDCQVGVNSPVMETTSVRGPHLDVRYKMFAALVYFRHPDDTSTGGDLDIYRAGLQTNIEGVMRDATGDLQKVKTISYRPNTLIMWLNTPSALHGVSPRSLTHVPRRLVNFLGECYCGDGLGVCRLPQDPSVAVNDDHVNFVRRLARRILGDN